MLSALALAATMLGSSLGVGLRDDPRLQVAVSLEHPAKSIETILMDLSGKTNVRIEAADDIRQDLATLRVASRPAHEVMERIARHFGWAWEEKDDGYRLYRPAESRVAEEKALRKQLLQPYFDAQADARRYLAQVSVPDVEEMLRRYTELARSVSDVTDAEARRKVMDEMWEMRWALDGEDRLAALVLVSLTEADFEQIESVGKLVMSSRPTPAQRPLPGAARAALPLVIELTSATANAVEYEFDATQIRAVRVTIEGLDSAFSEGGMVAPQIEWLGPAGVLRTADSWPFPLEPSADEEPVVTPPRRLPPNLPASFGEAWAPPPDVRRALVGMTSGSTPAGMEFLERLVPGLVALEPLEPLAGSMLAAASSAEVNLIADAYDTHILAFDGREGLSFATVEAFFEAAADALEAQVTLGDGWLTMRTEGWPLGRAVTVPREHLFPFARLIQERRTTTFDAMAGFMAGLTPPQVTRGSVPSLLGVFNLLFVPDRASLAFSRGWVALQGVLPEGESVHDLSWGLLPVGTRTEWSKFLFLHGFQDGTPLELTNYFVLPSDVRAIPRRESEDEVGYDHEMTEILPGGVPGSTRLQLRFNSLRGVSMVVGDAVSESCFTVDTASLFSVRVWERERTPVQRRFRPCTLEMMNLIITVPSGPPLRIVFGGATVDVSARFESLERLPGPLGERLRRAIEAERARRAPPPRH